MSDPLSPAPRRTAPLGMVVGAVRGVRTSLLPAAAGAYGLRDEFGGIGFIAAFALLVVVIGSIGSVLNWWRTTFHVGDKDIRVETGVVRRAARSVPLDRIQDVSIEQPLLARVLGLAEVRLETGAGGSDEITLSYLPLAEAEGLRKLARERRDVAASPGERASEDAQEEGERLFALSRRRLVLLGMFEFSLAAVAVVAGLAEQFDFLLPFDIWEWREWRDALGLPAERIAALGLLAKAAGVALALASLAILGFTTGLGRTVAREWGFVLERTPRGFRRRRGLFTRSDLVMPVHRVQALQLRTGALRLRFGWYALKVVSLAQDAGSASHVVAPFARLGELEPIAAVAGFALPDERTAWCRPVLRAYLDTALVRATVPLLAALALVASPWQDAALLPLLALPPLALVQGLAWRRSRHAFDARQIYIRRGWLAPRTDVLNRAKLQSAEIVQGPLARRGGYATLHLGLAGGTATITHMPVAEARSVASAALDSMAAIDFARIA